MPDSYQGRWLLAKYSVEKMAENPFRMLGYGRRSFVKYFKDFESKYPEAGMWHAHNTFMNIALQTGVQGLIVFCFLLYKILLYCYKNWRVEEAPVRKYYFLATFGMIIAFFVRNFSDDFFIDDSALLFWFLSGIIFARKIEELDKEHGVG